MKKYKVITLCGSTKFKEEFLKAQKEYARQLTKKLTIQKQFKQMNDQIIN